MTNISWVVSNLGLKSLSNFENSLLKIWQANDRLERNFSTYLRILIFKRNKMIQTEDLFHLPLVCGNAFFVLS